MSDVEEIIQDCLSPLNQIKDKTVFIAGMGFYGSRFYDVFSKFGITVKCGSRSKNGWDILCPDTYTDFQKNADYVINCAGRCDVMGDLETLAYGPFLLCQNKREDSVFLQISSGVVSKRGSTPYCAAKQIADLKLIGFKNVKTVRPFATVGPNMGLDKSFAISTFIDRTLNNKPLEVAANVKRSFCYISDLITQMIHILVLGNLEPYDVGSDDLIDLIDAAKIISKNVNKVENTFAANAPNVYCADLTRIIQEFGFLPRYSSLEAVQKTLLWYVKGN